MSELIKLLRKGNKSAIMAAVVNTIISIIKGIAFALTGNVAMFAETMHSLGDAANQFFVFIGSALSKKVPTKRFPNGFGRLVNLVLLGAVLVVGIMAFETIKEGYHHILHPTKSSGFILNIAVLGISVLLEMFVLFKAMKETARCRNEYRRGQCFYAKLCSFKESKASNQAGLYGRSGSYGRRRIGVNSRFHFTVYTFSPS